MVNWVLAPMRTPLCPRKFKHFREYLSKWLLLVQNILQLLQKMGHSGWGWGRYGNLGLGDRNDRLIPQKVSTVDDEKMVMFACGWRHTISVSSSGSLYTYGWSKYGQLGHGDFEDHLVPRKLEALSGSFVSETYKGGK